LDCSAIDPRHWCASTVITPAFVRSQRIRSTKMVKALMIGVGGVGEAIARMAAERDWIEMIVLAGESHR